MQERRKSRTKSFRFDVNLIEGLRRAADHAAMSENEFVSEALADRVLIDPLVRAFREVKFSAETFQAILGGTDANTLEMSGSQIARKNFPLVFELYRNSKHPLAFREFVVEVLGKHSGWFYVEDDDVGTQQWMILRHSFGRKWSLFVKSYILSAHSAISKDRIEVEIADQFIRIDFSPGRPVIIA